MAWSITSLANYNENTAGSNSQTTGTLSIPANSVLLVFGHGSYDWPSGVEWDSATMFVSDSVDGTTGWVGLDSQINLGVGFARGGGRAFYKSFTSSASRTITVGRDVGSVSWGYCVTAITGQDTANPIVQATGAGTFWGDAGNSHSQAVTFSSAPTSGNAVVTYLGTNNDASGAATQPAGYTSLDAPTAPYSAASSAYHTSTTSTSVNWSDCGEQIGYAVVCAVELRVPGAGAPDTGLAWIKA